MAYSTRHVFGNWDSLCVSFDWLRASGDFSHPSAYGKRVCSWSSAQAEPIEPPAGHMPI